MNDFGDLLGTPYAPVSKIAPVKNSYTRVLKKTKKKQVKALLNPTVLSYCKPYFGRNGQKVPKSAK